MIQIVQHNEPANFDTDVRIPGTNFLAIVPHPSKKQFQPHKYWNRIHNDLYVLYDGICAYCASWTPRRATPSDPNYTSVDHYIPKSKNPGLAYDWLNYRLCRARMNANKADSLEVLDPFFIQNGWFVIDFTSFLILPNSSIEPWKASRIEKSIEILGLNDNDFVDQRLDIIYSYSQETISFADLSSTYPFIAMEMKRQDFDNNFKDDIKMLSL
ncbi:HNH endonuclease family protein [Flavobacterium silvaticum]|uniref:HNH endonuclease n=1 Tax=Flavobacterium silvaticum TaxID=1852020 RepID=A0A972FQD9_9FLAO|nr:hypothetical protein [Flavobacterium silvaticum]NMH26543.1 hypothetical protein [Flavobacterium silvaticum]